MNNEELSAKFRSNLFGLIMSLDDAPYHGFTGDNIRGAKWAIGRMIEGTGLTTEQIVKEGFAENRAE